MSSPPHEDATISVLICSRGRPEPLDRTVRSLFACRPVAGRAVQLVLVSSACALTTGAAATLAHEAPDWLEVELLECPETGKSRAVNLGLEACRGELVAFTDDDVVIDPGYLEGLVEGFSATGADALQGRVLPLLECPAPDWWTRHCEALLATTHYLDRRPDTPLEELNSCNMAVRASAARSAGGWSERLGPGSGRFPLGDDSEWTRRLHRRGFRFAFWPAMEVAHLIPGDRLTRPYILRRAFHTGLTESAARGSATPRQAGRSLLRVAIDGFQALLSLVAGRPGPATDRLLQVARHLGVLWGMAGGARDYPREGW